MSNLILASHGLFCEELKKSVEMIVGSQDNIYTVALSPEESDVDLDKKFEEIISQLDEFVVFVDLLGGTPCNVLSKKIMSGATFDMYAGMNMPMILAFVNGELIQAEVDYIEDTRNSILKVNDLLLEDENFSEDE